MRSIFTISSLLIGLSLSSCQSCKPPAGQIASAPMTADSLNSLCLKTFGTKEFIQETSENDSLVLCYSQTKRTPSLPRLFTRYLVVDSVTNRILRQGEIQDGTISWIGPRTLQISKRQEVAASDPEINQNMTTETINL